MVNVTVGDTLPDAAAVREGVSVIVSESFDDTVLVRLPRLVSDSDVV